MKNITIYCVWSQNKKDWQDTSLDEIFLKRENAEKYMSEQKNKNKYRDFFMTMRFTMD